MQYGNATYFGVRMLFGDCSRPNASAATTVENPVQPPDSWIDQSVVESWPENASMESAETTNFIL